MARPPRTLVVPKGQPQRLDAFLGRALPAWERPQLEQLLARGLVRVNGKLAQGTRRLHGGETVALALDPPPPAPKVLGPLLALLHQDDGLVIVDKPAGHTVEPESMQALPSVVELLATQLRGLEVGGQAFPGVVHRLDKETTGCLALAKTDAAFLELKDAFEAKRARKTYLALVRGAPADTGSLDTPYTRDPKNPKRFTTTVDSPRRARLSWVVKERFPAADLCLLEIDLDTGRTHQIRAQLAEQGFPVYGDPLYGGPVGDLIARVALHATRLQLERASGPLAVEAPLPGDLQHALERARSSGPA